MILGNKHWAVVGLAAFFSMAPLAAVQDQENLTQFVPENRFVVDVDGALDEKAAVYVSQRPIAYLIRSGVLEDAFVLWPSSFKVERIAASHLTPSDKGALTVAGQYRLVELGRFEVTAADVKFEADGHTVVLRQRPPLLGYQTADSIKKYDALYLERAQAYQPDGETLNGLRSFDQPCEVLIVFGSWCPHCQLKVPLALRVQDDVTGSRIKFQYYAVPRGHAFSEDPLVVKTNVSKVPTAIVTIRGQEVGRFVGTDFDHPEVKLLEVLKSAGAGR